MYWFKINRSVNITIMKSIHYQFFVCIIFLGFISVGNGQNLLLKQTNESGVYRKGQKIQVALFSKDPGKDSIEIKILRNFGLQYSKNKIRYVGDSLVIFEEVSDKPGSIIIELSTKSETTSIGLIVDPENFKPVTTRPKDFDKFWNNEKAALRSLPMKVKAVEVASKETGYRCFDMEINCTGSKPARGYFAKPDSAKAKTLPIVVYFHAAGVNPNWARSEPGNAIRYATMGKGALSFDLNAHGMLNGQPDEYYNLLNDGELKDYPKQGLDNKQKIYFRGMYLRIIRTLEFLTNQPEWDRNRILVIGESQGGGQALAAAGLDHRVSAVVATVPAMCDWGGFLVERKDSWPYPYASNYDKYQILNILPYFDVVHLLKGSKAKLVVEIGLIDQSCLSTAIYAAINQAKGPKIIFNVPYRAHHLTQESYREMWQNSVNKPKDRFILNYLK